MVAFIVRVSTFFFFFSPQWLLIEKRALVEFSDRMSNTSLMAPGTAFECQEQVLVLGV